MKTINQNALVRLNCSMKATPIFTDDELKLISQALYMASIHQEAHSESEKMFDLRKKLDVVININNLPNNG